MNRFSFCLGLVAAVIFISDGAMGLGEDIKALNYCDEKNKGTGGCPLLIGYIACLEAALNAKVPDLAGNIKNRLSTLRAYRDQCPALAMKGQCFGNEYQACGFKDYSDSRINGAPADTCKKIPAVQTCLLALQGECGKKDLIDGNLKELSSAALDCSKGDHSAWKNADACKEAGAICTKEIDSLFSAKKDEEACKLMKASEKCIDYLIEPSSGCKSEVSVDNAKKRLYQASWQICRALENAKYGIKTWG